MSRVIGPPWRVVDRDPDIGAALRTVQDLAERIAAQVECDHHIDAVVMPTAAEWLALFDVVAAVGQLNRGCWP